MNMRCITAGLLYLVLLVLIPVPLLFAGDSLEGVYRGTADPDHDSTKMPEVEAEFTAGGSIIIRMLGDWALEPEIDDKFYYFPGYPEVTPEGDYEFYASQNELTFDALWTGKEESTSDDGVYVTRVYVESDDELSISPDRQRISGPARSSERFLYDEDQTYNDGETYDVDLVRVPNKTTNPSPPDGAVGIPTDTNLCWLDGGGSVSYDVYFGTDSTPDSGEFKGNQTATCFNPGALAYNTTYYWRIDAKTSRWTTTGNVWRFTTGNPPPPSIRVKSPNGGERWRQGSTYKITWDSVSIADANVKIYLYNSAGYVTSLSGGTPNDGSYDWWIDPAVIPKGSTYKICVLNQDKTIRDYSDKAFIVQDAQSAAIGWLNYR